MRIKNYSDLPGKAILDYYEGTIVEELLVLDEFGPGVEMPIDAYFRDFDEMPELERTAMQMCYGKVLDIGAGAGSHVLYLQEHGVKATALEISPTACEIMKKRGVESIIQQDIFEFSGQKFDTLLLLMNGIGLCADMDGLTRFLEHAKTLLNPKGQLLFDSCNVNYMYEEVDKPKERYYGEIRYKYRYGNVETDWFQWLYIDIFTLEKHAKALGWKIEVIEEDENDQYLVKLTLSDKK